MITQSFDLNLIPESSPVVVHCDQYDKGTGRLVISLYDEYIAYSPSGTAKIQGVKPDGKGFEYDASISGNVVTANLTEQMSAVAGRVRCQIVVTETTGRTGTFVFILDVQPSALPLDTDLSESDYQFIEQAIEAAEDAQEYSEDAEAWAVGERGGVPVGPSDPTYENNAEYWSQIAAQYAQGALHYVGSITFSQLPTNGMSGGDMYNITDDFVTDSRFIEGAGHQCYAGQNVAWVASVSKWDLPAVPHIVPDMTSSTKGIGRPDGKTTEVSSGVFNAIGVSIPAEVYSGATQYASNWLYYEGTTEVITPSTKQNYRVIESGTAKLYYWTGLAYAELTSGGGGGGMNTDGSNADATVGFTNTNVFTIGDRTGKSAAGRYAIELGDGANATGYGSYAEGAKNYSGYTANYILAANTSSESLVSTLSLITYPYQSYSLQASPSMPSNIEVFVDGGLAQDEIITRTFAGGVVTVRLTQDGNNIKAYFTNTDSSIHNLYTGYQDKQNKASGAYSHVEGSGNTASGQESHAEGLKNSASGAYSHVEGSGNTASGQESHAEGGQCVASGYYSHAEGHNTVASGNSSHAEGLYTKASSSYQHAGGKYNVNDASNTYAWIVGNGTAENTRSNAMTLDWDGNLMAAGRFKDADGQIYDKTVALTHSEYQTLVDNDEDDPNTEYYIEDIDVAEAYYVETSGQTALTGATSLTFTNSHIKPTADIRILAEPASCKVSTNPQYKVSAKLSSVGNGTATITFPALAENTTFWLLIECPLAVTVDPEYVYNTDETVIGEYLGHTLYRKVITGVTLPSPSTDGASSSKFVSVGTTFTKAITIKGVLDLVSGSFIRSMPLPYLQPTSSNFGAYQIGLRGVPNNSSSNANSIELYNNAISWGGLSVEIIIEYIKD